MTTAWQPRGVSLVPKWMDRTLPLQLSADGDVTTFRAPSNNASACRICGKTFDGKWYMARHMRSHLGLRPYQCSLCQAKFTQKQSCVVHIKRTHQEVNPVPFLVEIAEENMTIASGI